MTTALGSFGDLNIAAKYLKQVDSDGYLTENIAGSFLHNAYKTHTAEEVAATYSNTTASSGGLGSLFGGAGLMAGNKVCRLRTINSIKFHCSSSSWTSWCWNCIPSW